jgi:thymidylate synthase ThyX
MKKILECVDVKLLDYSPKYLDFGPDSVIAASGFLTAKIENFSDFLSSLDKKSLEVFHKESTRRGHASLTTSINFYFWLEGSKISDFYFSNFPFGSYIICSTRRIKFTEDLITIPESIIECGFEKEYQNVCKKLLDTYQILFEKYGVDIARKLLPLSIKTFGFFSFPLQTIIGIIKDCEKIDIYPKEIIEIGKRIKNFALEKAPLTTNAAEKLIYDNSFSKPNIFNGDLLSENYNLKKLYSEKEFEELVKQHYEKIEKLKTTKEKAEEWKRFVTKIKDLVLFSFTDKISLACFTDLKRHRTMKQNVENIYNAIDRAINENIKENFFIPSYLTKEVENKVEESYSSAIQLYEKMVENGVPKTEAVYTIPLGLKIKYKIYLDGYHIFDPFGFIGVRSCITADNEIVAIMNKIISELVNFGIPYDLLGPKCKIGFCPERKFCSIIKRFVQEYDENIHNSIQKS